MRPPALGAMRHRLTLQSPQDTADEIGGAARIYTNFAQVWAAIEPLSGTRLWQSQQAEQQISHRITIVFRADVSGDLRFILGSRIFEIKAAFDPDETGRFLVCDCWEVKP